MNGLAIALIVSMSFNVLLTVLVLTIVRSSATSLERSHERTTSYTKDLLDRLAARDWQHYRDEISPPGAIDEQESPRLEVVPTIGPDRGGFGSRLGLRAYAGPEINPEEDMP